LSPRSQHLLVLIPAYNERAAIRQVVSSVRASVPDADVLVVDDGSCDNTLHEAQAAGALVIRHPFNLGIGATVQTGLKFAQQEDYNMVIRVDGDGQHDPVDVPMLISSLQAGQVDVAVGSRFLNNTGSMGIPFMRRLGIFTFALLVSVLTGHRVTDTTSGFFALNRRAIAALATYMPQDYPEVESRIVLHKAGLKTLELPTHMRGRFTGVSSIDCWRSIYYAFKVSVSVLIGAVKDVPRSSADPTSFNQARLPGHRAGPTHRIWPRS
jgi:glycosyltransferase involved in cell wall biosynthesis